MPDAKASTPDRGLAHRVANVANALTNAFSAVTTSASAAADKVVTAAVTAAVEGGLVAPAPAGANSVVITRPDGSKKVEPLRCLFCGGKIED